MIPGGGGSYGLLSVSFGATANRPVVTAELTDSSPYQSAEISQVPS
jgi:hypothetical protein